MGMRLLSGNAGRSGIDQEGRRNRFDAYFPRVFAYVQHCAGDETVTREMVTEAFARAFARAGKLGEEDFRLALFGAARELMDLIRGPSTREGLTVRERDLVALLFDGLLDHREVARLLSISEEGVTAELVRALKKLRTGKETPNVPSVLRA